MISLKWWRNSREHWKTIPLSIQVAQLSQLTWISSKHTHPDFRKVEAKINLRPL